MITQKESCGIMNMLAEMGGSPWSDSLCGSLTETCLLRLRDAARGRQPGCSASFGLSGCVRDPDPGASTLAGINRGNTLAHVCFTHLVATCFPRRKQAGFRYGET